MKAMVAANPFASALVELLSRPQLTLAALPSQLSELTLRMSRGIQQPQVPLNPEPAAWTLLPKRAGETRSALVVVFSDYSASDGAPSLPGAKRDAIRVGASLSGAGFDTQTFVDPSRR